MKKVLITGGTGTLGKKLLEILSKSKQYDLYFTYANSHKEAKLLSKKYQAKAIQVINANCDKLPNNFDIVINTAAIGAFGDVTHTVPDQLMREALEINLMLPFKISKLVLPYMMKQKWGRIINISSINGLIGYEFTVAYNASKFALNGLTKTIAREYAKYNITCNAICPAAIGEAGLAIDAAKFYSKNPKQYQEEINEYKKSTPIGRMANVAEIANVAIFLMSEQASYVNGVTLPVDGGKLA